MDSCRLLKVSLRYENNVKRTHWYSKNKRERPDEEAAVERIEIVC
jgi:hypothetical protein